MPATRKARGRSNSKGKLENWPDELARGLEKLGVVTTKFPALYPHGITKIELELGFLSEKTKIRILIEGPQKKDGTPDTIPDRQ